MSVKHRSVCIPVRRGLVGTAGAYMDGCVITPSMVVGTLHHLSFVPTSAVLEILNVLEDNFFAGYTCASNYHYFNISQSKFLEQPY